MKMPWWLCVLLFSNCKWVFLFNTRDDRGFHGVYRCSRCGEESTGAPRKAAFRPERKA